MHITSIFLWAALDGWETFGDLPRWPSPPMRLPSEVFQWMMYPKMRTRTEPDVGTHSIKRQSVPEAVAASLRDRILTGEFADGDQLRQEAIAAEYEVSRMPVREALRQLEAEGLVRFQTHKGAIVTKLSPREVGELFDLRVLLETDLLQHAIPRMTEPDFAATEGVMRRLETAYHERDASAWGAVNWEYHQSLYDPADRPQTMSLAVTINNQTDRYVRLQLLLTGEIDRAERDHRELLLLCRARDIKRAVPFLRKHILDTKNELLDIMQRDLGGSSAASGIPPQESTRGGSTKEAAMRVRRPGRDPTLDNRS